MGEPCLDVVLALRTARDLLNQQTVPPGRKQWKTIDFACKSMKIHDFHDFRASSGRVWPRNAATGSGMTAWVLLTPGIDCRSIAAARASKNWFFTPKLVREAECVQNYCAEGPKKGKIQDFHVFFSLRRPRTSPDCPHWFRNDGVGPPDLWQSISDRLLPPQLLKTGFSLRIWSGRLCACKGYAPYALYAP